MYLKNFSYVTFNSVYFTFNLIKSYPFLSNRLREAAEPKRTFLPRFGSKYRYSGRTLYQTRTLTDDRPQPFFERTASKQFLNNNANRTFDESKFLKKIFITIILAGIIVMMI